MATIRNKSLHQDYTKTNICQIRNYWQGWLYFLLSETTSCECSFVQFFYRKYWQLGS